MRRMFFDTDLNDIRILASGTVDFTFLRLGNTRILRLMTPPSEATWERTRFHDRTRAVLILISRGSLQIVQGSTELTANEGAALFLPTGTEPVQLRFLGPQNLAHYISVENADFAPLPQRGAIAWLLNSPEQALLIPAIRAALDAGIPRVHTQVPLTRLEPLVGFFLAGMSALLTAPPILSSDAGATDLGDQAMELIERHHRDARFTADAIAEHLGVSARTLQRHVSARGTTIARALRLARTESAVDLIQTERTLDLESIAHRAGFSGAQVLRLALREFLNTTPSALRRTTETARSVPSNRRVDPDPTARSTAPSLRRSKLHG